MIGIDRPAVRLRVGAVAAASAVVLSGCTGSAERAATTTPGGSASSTSAVTTSTTTTTSAAVTRSSTVPAQPMRTTTPTRARVPPRPRSTPKPSPKPAPKPPSGTGVTGQFLSLVNSERAKAGCGAVRSNSALQRAAQGHSADMAAKNYFSHTSKDGRTFADRIRAAGYGGSTIGENIAAGQSTASAVMRSWLASSGHRANILNCAFTAIGVGYARGGSYGHYWTQDFGG
ncbi:CAP domain-containing protein [Pedococcus bigeumensis]|nr:CAP domain-containing protein [Pedococcus bigeumensis]